MGATSTYQTGPAVNQVTLENSTRFASNCRNNMKNIIIGDNSNIYKNPIFIFMDDDGIMIENDSDTTDTDDDSDDDMMMIVMMIVMMMTTIPTT
eukprot:107391_1